MYAKINYPNGAMLLVECDNVSGHHPEDHFASYPHFKTVRVKVKNRPDPIIVKDGIVVVLSASGGTLETFRNSFPEFAGDRE